MMCIWFKIRFYQSLKSLFLNHLQCWLSSGQITDPYKEFLIIPQEETGKETCQFNYKIIQSSALFVSKDVLNMIFEIGRLVHIFTTSYHGDFRRIYT